MLDASVRKMTISDQYKPIFRMVRQWAARYGRHAYVGVEIDGQQQLNLHSLKQQMIVNNSYFSFTSQIGSPSGKEGISRRQASGAKHEQFMRVHPLFQQKKIYFPEEMKDSIDMKEILNELKYITYEGIGSKADDALDGLSMIATMDVMYPSIEQGSVAETSTYSDREGMWTDPREYYKDSDEYSNSVVF